MPEDQVFRGEATAIPEALTGLPGAGPAWEPSGHNAANAIGPALVTPLPAPVPGPDAGAGNPLSLQQEQVWFARQLAPEGHAHHAQTMIHVAGPFDVDLLDRVLTEMTRRHEMLRTTYAETDGTPCQVVHAPQPVRAKRVDLRAHREGQHKLLDEIAGAELRTPFDAEHLPLIRWTVVQLADEQHELIVVAHHLLHDGWTFSLLLREFRTLYNAFGQGAESSLPEPGLQYRDFAHWQRATLQTPLMQEQLAYWQNQLRDLPPLLELPLDRPRPATQSFRGQTIRVDLPDGLSAGLHGFCQDHEVTVFSTMLAAFHTLLYRYTGQADVCVGSWFAGRRVPRTEDVVGRLVNTVLLRCEVDATLGFADLVEKVHRVVLDATANDLLPFPELVRVLNPDREPGRNPLTDVLFSVDDSPSEGLVLDLAGATGTVSGHGNAGGDGSAKTDLHVTVTRLDGRGPDRKEADGRITMLWEYAADLFDAATVQRMADGYLRLLADAIHRPTTPLFKLAVLSPQERKTILDDWNPEPRPTAHADAGPLVRAGSGVHSRPGGHDGLLVHDAVRAQARRTPDATAVRDGAREVSYAELIHRADSLAGILHARGVVPRAVVGVCLPRGVDLVIAQLAVLFAGAAYLPLDPENPPVRLADQYTAAGAVLVLTDRVTAERLPGDLPQLPMDRLPEPAEAVPADRPPTRPDDLAYLIATSGSTGRPKLVMVEHRSLANAVAWRCRRCDLGPTDRIGQVASPGFDTSVMDIWPTLVSGAALYVPDLDTRLDPERLRTWLVEEGITVTELPTALGERVLALSWPPAPALRELITGGDRLRVRPAADLPFRVLNEYGPTEITATATAGHVDPAGSDGPPDIGRPITGARAYVLDAGRQLVPPGATGELWIGGIGVARGYHGAPGLTADRFVADPYAGVPGRRMYRTGDLARHLPDGRIAFIGRRDRQIKLRGYRIEPAEIVEVLRAHPAVTDAVVLARSAEDGLGEKRLVAYLEAKDRPDLRQQVREHLANRLPRYMIPSDVMVLDALPLNRNGKVDERALPAPGPAEPEAGFRPPRTETERRLADTWCAVLRLERVGVDDNFFDVGGHSLLLAAVQRELARQGHDLPIVTFFEHTTVHQLAAYLDDRAVAEGKDVDESGGAARGAGRARLDRRRAAARSAGVVGGGDSTRQQT
ncbi:non-ribosomal peptide synthetase [Streptomyces cadmiisoli]|uniref:non-ribosomal peptide synthetase n=1 Tax=Streptomyces cadmiisoli TaxID=2184053 RepID=UPI003D74179E